MLLPKRFIQTIVFIELRDLLQGALMLSAEQPPSTSLDMKNVIIEIIQKAGIN